MENFWRFVLTITIWVLSAGIAITALIVSENSNTDPSDIAILSIIGALVATFIIWGIPALAGESSTQSTSIKETIGKAKRGDSSDDRMSMLLQLMTPDERETFKQSLQQQILQDARLSSDGEIITENTSLDSLLYEENEQQRYT